MCNYSTTYISIDIPSEKLFYVDVPEEKMEMMYGEKNKIGERFDKRDKAKKIFLASKEVQ